MKRLLKSAAYVAVGLVLVIGLVLGFVYFNTSSRMDRTYEVNPDPLPMAAADTGTLNGDLAGKSANGHESSEGMHTTDGDGLGMASAATLAWGEHIAVTRGCSDCHSQDYGGAVFADEMPVFRLSASNLTSAGVGSGYSDTDWIRAIRHGIGADGKPLLFMPSYEYYFLGDEDLAALILYLKSLPAVSRELPENRVGPVGRILFMTGKLPLVPAEMIDHDGPRPVAPPRGATVEYGAYLAKGCIGCHGATLSGGPIPGVPPGWPEASNITPDPETGIGNWTRDDFFRSLKEGRRPDGTQLQAEFMPWPNIGRLHDDEMKALWMYLREVEAKGFGGR